MRANSANLLSKPILSVPAPPSRTRDGTLKSPNQNRRRRNRPHPLARFIMNPANSPRHERGGGYTRRSAARLSQDFRTTDPMMLLHGQIAGVNVRLDAHPFDDTYSTPRWYSGEERKSVLHSKNFPLVSPHAGNCKLCESRGGHNHPGCC